jgi:nitrite reductase (NO-forming)
MSMYAEESDVELDDTSHGHLILGVGSGRGEIKASEDAYGSEEHSSGPEVYDEPPERRSRRRTHGKHWWWPCGWSSSEKCILFCFFVLSFLVFLVLFRVTLGPVGSLIDMTIIAQRGYFVGGSPGIHGVINPTIHVQVNDMVHVKLVNGESEIHELMIEGYPGLRPLRTVDRDHPDKLTFQARQEGYYRYSDSFTDGDMNIPGYMPNKEVGMTGFFYVGGKTTHIEGPEDSRVPLLNDSQLHLAHGDKYDIVQRADAVFSSISRTTNQEVRVDLECDEKLGRVVNGVSHVYWTFGGTVPGPMIRAMEGDTIVVTLSNPETNGMPHWVSFHGANGGFARDTPAVAPGETLEFRFQAQASGVYLYGEPSSVGLSKGLFGLMVVEPRGGLPAVDKEFYVVQHELYGDFAPLYPGHLLTHAEHLLKGVPSYVVFNGAWQGLTGPKELTAEKGQTVRLFVGAAGM